jgi:hypothetical protein
MCLLFTKYTKDVCNTRGHTLKDRQYNGQTNRGKHLYRNLEIEQREPNYKPGMNYDEPEGRTDFAPLVAPVVLLFLFQTQ